MSHLIYEIRIELQGIKPPIWRKLQVPADIKLHKLHEVFQIAMGWTNSHLHLFKKDEDTFMDPELDDEGNSLNENKIGLKQLILLPNHTCDYEYDFGDSWEHKIMLLKILETDMPLKKAKCLTGKRACPPEDVGGVCGYADFLDAISDSSHKEHDEFLEWVGGQFDSEAFDIIECNKYLQRLNLTKKNDDYMYNLMVERFG